MDPEKKEWIRFVTIQKAETCGTLSLTAFTDNSSIFLSYTILSSHDGVLWPLVTDTAIVLKLLNIGVNKYLSNH